MKCRLTVGIAAVLMLEACRGSPQPGNESAQTPAPPMPAAPHAEFAVAAVRHFPPKPAIKGVTLVDETRADVGTVERSLYHLAVRHDSTIDTLPNLVVLEQPVMVGDSVILGEAFDSTSDDVYFLFRYSAPAGQLELLRPPPDLSLAVSIPAFSPGGRYLAYVSYPGDGTGAPVVLDWPSKRVLIKAEGDTVPAADDVGGWAQWSDSTHFEFAITIDAGGRYAHFLGAVGQAGIHVDTVATTTHGTSR